MILRKLENKAFRKDVLLWKRHRGEAYSISEHFISATRQLCAGVINGDTPPNTCTHYDVRHYEGCRKRVAVLLMAVVRPFMWCRGNNLVFPSGLLPQGREQWLA